MLDLQQQTKTHTDGIYFGLSFEDYLTDTALGSSDIRNLLTSPLAYWANSHLNPNRLPDEDTAAQSIGTLIHEVLLENPNKVFATKPDGMSFATKEGKAWRKEQEDAGRTILNQKDANTLATIIRATEAAGIREALHGCVPEVSYFWTHPSGYRCKIRLDAMGKDCAFDLKTFANMMNKDIETCIAHAVANNRYHVTAYWYRQGIEDMRAKIRAGKENIFGADGEPYSFTGPVVESPLETIRAIRELGDADYRHWYCFLEKDGIPNVVVREFAKRSGPATQANAYWVAAHNEVNRATDTFAKYSAEFEPGEMWMRPVPYKVFDDIEFGAARWILED